MPHPRLWMAENDALAQRKLCCAVDLGFCLPVITHAALEAQT